MHIRLKFSQAEEENTESSETQQLVLNKYRNTLIQYIYSIMRERFVKLINTSLAISLRFSVSTWIVKQKQEIAIFQPANIETGDSC